MKPARIVPLAILFGALVILVVVPTLYGLEYPKSIASVFDDVVTLGQLSCLVGFVSDLGIVLWFAMALFFLHGLHRSLQQGPVSGDDLGFYLGFAALALWLGLDDRLLIHEWLTNQYRIPEVFLMAVYGSAVLLGGWRYRVYLALAGVGWLWVALPCFGISVVMDLELLPWLIEGRISAATREVIEEGFKWIGICTLFLYVFVLTAHLPFQKQK
jgi:hypothetical protein